jgi:hypothetical protein
VAEKLVISSETFKNVLNPISDKNSETDAWREKSLKK